MNLIGQMLGEYRIVEEIGRGGMATVYRAYQPTLERYVALKVLPVYFQQDVEFLRRFHHEAKAAARLNHPNIVRIYGVGESRGLNYMVMEYADGGSLRDRLVAGKPLESAEAVHIISQVAAALDYAHRRGVIHRDIKPSNILLTGDGRVLLSDFGIAKVSELSQLTRTGTFLGTAEYTSPEQAESQPVDARSDLYSLGVVLYQMLTGRVPFSGETMQAIMYAHCHKAPPPPTRFNRSLPKSVEAVVWKALSKRKADRFQSGQEMTVALRQAMRELVTQPAAAQGEQKPNRLALPLIGGAIIVALILVWVLLTFGPGKPREGTPPTLTAIPTSTATITPTAPPIPPTATPTLTALISTMLPAPRLLQPAYGQTCMEAQVFEWEWKGTLEANDWFELWMGQEDDLKIVGRTQYSEKGIDLDRLADILPQPGEYYWQVVVVRQTGAEYVPISTPSEVSLFKYERARPPMETPTPVLLVLEWEDPQYEPYDPEAFPVGVEITPTLMATITVTITNLATETVESDVFPFFFVTADSKQFRQVVTWMPPEMVGIPPQGKGTHTYWVFIENPEEWIGKAILEWQGRRWEEQFEKPGIGVAEETKEAATSPPPTETPSAPPPQTELEPVTCRVVERWDTPAYIARLYTCVTAEQIMEANGFIPCHFYKT